MDTIVTPVTVITLDSTRIVHSIKTDLVARYFPPVVRLVQYDQSLPVIAVSLMQNGQTYTLPSGAAANIRVHKPDATYVYNPALGCDSTRKIVYFEVTQAMAAANGDGLAIVEIVVNGDIAGTSLITLHFEENPVPENAIESSDEWETIYELGERIIASTVTPVSTAAGMTDHNVVYLYTGTESGWNQGHMYYYNGTTWVDAGIASTDKTLSVENMAADAKKTGDEIADLKDGLNTVKNDLGKGKNLYNNDLEQGALDAQGKNTVDNPNARCRSKGFIAVEEGETYSVSLNYTASTNNPMIVVNFYPDNQYSTARSGFVGWIYGRQTTFTVPTGCSYIRLLLGVLNESNISYASFKKIQVEKSSYQTQYEMPLADLPEYVNENFGITSLNIERGGFDGQGFDGPNNDRARTTGHIPVISRTIYTVETEYSGFQFGVSFYANTTDARLSTTPWMNVGEEFTVPYNCNYIRIIFKRTNGGSFNEHAYSDTGYVLLKASVINRSRDAFATIKYYFPQVGELNFNYYSKRDKTIQGGGDIAYYNGTFFGFDHGQMYVNDSIIPITNGHGNNCMFGKTLHGDYPYLYCGSWIKDDCKVYINQVTNDSATLVKTINYPTLSGYLNACVDEPNNRIYILLNVSETTYEGVIHFIVSDMDGNILSNEQIENIPVVQGMTFHKGNIYVTSGDGTTDYPNTLTVLDTNGNVISRSDNVVMSGEFEGIDFYNGCLYIATQTAIYHN